MFSLRSIAAALFAAWLAAAPALRAAPAVDGYAVRSWHTENGLPTNTVSSAVQTRDGYLWFGTPAGLARFDGEWFLVFNPSNTPSLGDGQISSLFEDSQGVLWIGHETGAITRHQHGRFEGVALQSKTAREKVISLGSDEAGRVWALRESGAADALDHSAHLAPSLPLPRSSTAAWSRSAHGDIWLAAGGQLARLTRAQWTTVPVNTDGRPDAVLGVAASVRGGVWLVCEGPRVRRWLDGRWVEDRGDYPASTGPVSCCLELRDGTLAVGTVDSGLYLIFGDGRPSVHLDRTGGLPQNWIRFLYEDRENNLWVGAGSAGLAAIHQSPFSVLNPPDRWDGRTVLSVAPGRGDTLWIGTEGSGIYRYASGTWTHYGRTEGLDHLHIGSVAENAAGDVWAGDHGWGGPRHLMNGRFIRHEKVDTDSPPVLALEAGSAGGEVLAGNRDGLMRVTATEAHWLYQSPPGTTADVCAIVRDRADVVWFALAQGGLGRLADGKVSIFRRQDGLPSDAVQCLLVDEDSDTLWIGTADAGLVRLKQGKFAKIDHTNGLADSAISHLQDDGLGYLWLSTRHGIQRIAKVELNQCADGLYGWVPGRVFDRSHGLPTLEFTGGRQGTGCKTADGRLWFASSQGLVSVDPSRVQPNPTPPPVIIEAFMVDSKSIAFAEGTVGGALPPDHARLEIHYAGLSFVAPSRVLFNYKLEGIDRDWVPAGDRRTAYYSHLPAGSYRFRVIARNDNDPWNQEGASLAFTVAPFFWQTWWFRSACALAALSGVAWLVRFLTRRRMLRRVEELERLHAIERERARIARDIHDDLGGNLTRIAMLSQTAREKVREPQHAASVLAGIYSVAHEGIRALDEIVWAVDPEHDTLDSLVSYMGEYAQSFLAAANVRCLLDFPLELPAWPVGAETRHHLFLAFKEALNNTVKHAAATEVCISLSLRPDAFVLVVKDNGRGFSRQPPPDHAGVSGGHGLSNLQQRLATIGGRCEITSAPEGGTCISFIVEAPAAHLHPSRRIV